MAADRDPHRLDAMEVRRAFERAATTYDDAAVLQREIGARMAERLGFVKLDVSMILDAGCGTGIALGELAARYPDASVFGVDLAYAMTRAAQKRCASAAPAARGLLGRLLGSLAPSPGDAPRLICGDIVHLPLRSGAFDLVWSNLTLQWINEPEQAIADVHRVLRVGGLFSFTTFGPDTLKELRAAFAAADDHRWVVLPGVRDAALAYEPKLIECVRELGGEVALACALDIDTGTGRRLIHVEPGHRLRQAQLQQHL